MKARPESEYPTIRDLRDRLSDLVDEGFGEQPVQVLIVPDSTMQAIGRSTCGQDGKPVLNGKPALMIEMESVPGRLPVLVTSTDRWQHQTRSASVQ